MPPLSLKPSLTTSQDSMIFRRRSGSFISPFAQTHFSHMETLLFVSIIFSMVLQRGSKIKNIEKTMEAEARVRYNDYASFPAHKV